MIYVTHDQVEAMTLADRIVVLNNGVIEQVGSPIELYKSPKNQFVAEFIGSPRMNIIDLNEYELVVKNINIPDQSSKLGIRPEHIVIASSGDGKISGNVRHIENLGEHLLCYIKISTGAEITAKLDVNSSISEGSSIHLNWDRSQTHFFNSSNITIKHN
jgi:multiple sugar transport system ATP-binding protein